MSKTTCSPPCIKHLYVHVSLFSFKFHIYVKINIYNERSNTSWNTQIDCKIHYKCFHGIIPIANITRVKYRTCTIIMWTDSRLHQYANSHVCVRAFQFVIVLLQGGCSSYVAHLGNVDHGRNRAAVKCTTFAILLLSAFLTVLLLYIVIIKVLVEKKVPSQGCGSWTNIIARTVQNENGDNCFWFLLAEIIIRSTTLLL